MTKMTLKSWWLLRTLPISVILSGALISVLGDRPLPSVETPSVSHIDNAQIVSGLIFPIEDLQEMLVENLFGPPSEAVDEYKDFEQVQEINKKSLKPWVLER